MSQLIRNFIKSESGATAIEYSLIAAGIGLAIITAVQSVGQEVKGPFSDTAAGLQKRVSP
ncbi:MAG: Flp family type IVb pilin [Hyphomicrobiaceae bacterium]